MKLCMTLLVRDEATIIRENLEYHLSRGVDFFIATDNLSTDQTADFLKHYERKGLLRYILETSDDYSQDLWVTRMARMAFADHGADWVIHMDADEFWWPQVGEIKSILGRCPDDVDGLLVNRVDFLTPSNYDPARSMFDQMTICQVKSTNTFGKPLPPKACHRGSPEVEVHQGNHGFNIPGRKAILAQCSEAIIFHFPIRDFQSFEHKIALGGAAYERNRRLQPSVGGTWRWLYKKYLRDELKDYYLSHVFDADELTSLMRAGSAVRDDRLRDYVQSIGTKSRGG